MKTRSTRLGLLMALTLLTVFCLSAFVVAQADNERVTPRFVVVPGKPALPGTPEPASTLQEWSGSFTYNNTQYNYVMVGADPATNQGALIPTFLIPVKIVLSTGTTFDPLSGGPFSALARTITSPVFDHTTNYTQGGVNLGTTQYIDAYQRGNFWSIVQNNPNSHLLLGGATAGITVLPTLTLNVPAGSGHTGSPFGHLVGEVDINYFDTQISNYMTQQPQIQPNTVPIFIVNDVYLTEGGCCIGGYHSANGSQTYMMFDYDDHPGVFSQDVSALSHEVGEWADDPLTNNGGNGNRTPCGILENGDPLEGGSPGHPYGTWQYPLHGFTYNLQDLVFLRYFGADANTSVLSYWSFQNFPFTVICQNGS